MSVVISRLHDIEPPNDRAWACEQPEGSEPGAAWCSLCDACLMDFVAHWRRSARLPHNGFSRLPFGTVGEVVQWASQRRDETGVELPAWFESALEASQ